jgi:hypothetical protein
MPSVYQIIPPRGAPALLDAAGKEIEADLHDIATWERFGWGPFGSTSIRRLSGLEDNRDKVPYDEFLAAVLIRARDFHRTLAAVPGTPCPVRVITIGGDCMPTLARCIVSDKKGTFPRFEPLNRHEADVMFEAGDGRVTRASVLGSHLPGADDSESGSGYPEVVRRPPRHLQGADLPERAAAPAPPHDAARLPPGPRRRRRLLTHSRLSLAPDRIGHQVARRARRRCVAAVTCEGGFRGGSRTPTLMMRECPP